MKAVLECIDNFEETEDMYSNEEEEEERIRDNGWEVCSLTINPQNKSSAGSPIKSKSRIENQGNKQLKLIVSQVFSTTFFNGEKIEPIKDKRSPLATTKMADRLPQKIKLNYSKLFESVKQQLCVQRFEIDFLKEYLKEYLEGVWQDITSIIVTQMAKLAANLKKVLVRDEAETKTGTKMKEVSVRQKNESSIFDELLQKIKILENQNQKLLTENKKLKQAYSVVQQKSDKPKYREDGQDRRVEGEGIMKMQQNNGLKNEPLSLAHIRSLKQKINSLKTKQN